MTYNQTKRPSFSKAQRAKFIELHGHLCHWCLETILEGQAWQIEHVIPRELLPGKDADEPENLRPIHAKPCHAAKTALDRKLIAKSNRIIRQASPETRKRSKRPWPSKPIQGRGWEKKGVD